jgi:hypothetical protein
MRPTCPEGAPVWFQSAFAEITREEVGVKYDAVVQAWVDLEQMSGFAKGSKGLAAAGRPTELSDWIRDGRGRAKKMMKIDDLGRYQEQWWTWWMKMQPRWRVGTDGHPTRPAEYGSGWGGVDALGQNGLVSVVATLYWWSHADKVAGRTSGWAGSNSLDRAMADTLWVLQALKRTTVTSP